jgi:hypothetical protein
MFKNGLQNSPWVQQGSFRTGVVNRQQCGVATAARSLKDDRMQGNDQQSAQEVPSTDLAGELGKP